MSSEESVDVSARESYHFLAAWADEPDTTSYLQSKRQIRSALDEIDHLRHWKAEAIVVLSEWDDVWKAAGCPGPLGASKAASVRALFTPDEVNEARYCVDDGHWTGYECPPDCPGVWPAGVSAPDEVNEAEP